jgi:predicted phage terminase large subunit-like protein
MEISPQNLPKGISPEIVEKILDDRKVMTAVSRESFLYFFLFYFGRHVEFPLAPFHFEMFKLAQNEDIKTAVIMTFRNSGKSTILNTAYALWAIMGKSEKKHVVIASQTQQRSRDHLMNLRKEIEDNGLLKENLGPFNVGEDRWGATTLIIPSYKARISSISVEEGVRGLKEGPNRPDIIIADDIEDSNSVKNQDNRDKSFNWFTGELIPLGRTDVKIIVLGNFLHMDSILSRLEERITENKMEGIFLRVPIVTEKNEITWPGKFKSAEEVEKLRKRISNEMTWQRDFMLRAVAGEHQTVDPKFINYYDELPGPQEKDHFYSVYTGIDLAISKKETADYTAMVSARVYSFNYKPYIFILPNPVNERLNFPETMEKAKLLSKSLGNGYATDLIIEDTAYQKAAIDQLERDGYRAFRFSPEGEDKRARLALTTDMMEAGQILFPKEGASNLINQLTGFEIEKHDDLADAFAILILHIRKNFPNRVKCCLISREYGLFR